jgi:hypothetical protein
MRTLVLVGALVLVAVGLTGALESQTNEAFLSSEVKFADVSISGLSIIPASCPSAPPHFSGDTGLPSCGGTPGGGTPSYGTPGGGNPNCPLGYVRVGNQCVFVACPTGYVLQNGQCVFVACPAGFVLQNGQCVGQCVVARVCGSGSTFNMVVNSCTGAIIDNCPARGMGWTCSGGSCIPPAAPGVDLVVAPLLVRQGSPVNVSWTSSNVISCTVVGSNSDGTGSNSTGVWNTTTGNKPSSNIQAQTVYTLTCLGLDGSNATDAATVNVVPSWCEPGLSGCPDSDS